jgi:hypothetical protein
MSLYSHLKSGIPLGVLSPAPAIITTLLHFSFKWVAKLFKDSADNWLSVFLNLKQLARYDGKGAKMG